MPASAPPVTVRGGRPPSAAAIRAPIAASGAITRRIGRRDSDTSPIIRLVNGAAARMPASSRIVVPELPQSMSPAAGENRPAPP